LIQGAEVPQIVRESCVGGVIFLHQIPAALTTLLAERGIPYVMVNPDTEYAHDCIICDDYSGMTDALAFLREKHCKRLAFVWNENEHPSYVKRHAAFVDFTSRRKIEHVLLTRFSDDGSAERIAALLKNPDPIGFVVFEEMLPFLLAIVGKKLAQSVHVVTVNDLLSARFVPSVTSVRVPFLEMGREAVKMIAKKWELEHAQIPSVTVKPSLIEREPKI
jgi:DNA-binding LacI/PurR family transcriptional regulator